MMSDKYDGRANLQDISKRADFKEIAAKGGRVKSAKKTSATQINAMKRMNITKVPEVMQRIIKKIKDPNEFKKDIFSQLEALQTLSDDLNFQQQCILMKLKVEAFTKLYSEQEREGQKNTEDIIGIVADKIYSNCIHCGKKPFTKDIEEA